MTTKRTIVLWLAIYVVGGAISLATGFHMAGFTIAWICGGIAVYVIHPKQLL